MSARPTCPPATRPRRLPRWADGVRAWTGGERPRDVFVYFINGAKERAPAGAMALMAQLGVQAFQ